MKTLPTPAWEENNVKYTTSYDLLRAVTAHRNWEFFLSSVSDKRIYGQEIASHKGIGLLSISLKCFSVLLASVFKQYVKTLS